MSSSRQVRSTTASLLLGIAALVVVLPSAALWGTPLPALFSSADLAVAAPADVPERSEPTIGATSVESTSATSDPAMSATRLEDAEAPALRTEPWQPPIPLLFLLAVVVGLWSAAPVRVPGRPREHTGRLSAEVQAAGGVARAPILL